MNLDNPQLLIIAGPNGAGKSTYSKNLSSIDAFVFDADKEIAKIEARYPGLPGESVSYAVEQYFLDCVENALKNLSDFTIETNFRDAGLINTVERFRDKGYTVGLVYLGLRNVRQSINRVTERVHDGGHFVDKDSINYNYVEGLKNFAYFSGRFDNIEVIDASKNLYDLKSLLSVQDKQLTFVSDDLPIWARPVISEIVQIFNPRFPERDEDNEYRRGPRR